MDIGIYNAASSLSSLEEWQAATSQNIAAGNVPGYKGVQISFEEIRAGQMGIISGGQQVSLPVSMSGSSPSFDFSNGVINQTGVSTHAALNGPGFFKIQGEDFEYYSRDGEFHVNSKNQIVNKSGHPVLGENGPMIVNPEYGDITINELGQIRQGVVDVGKLSIVDVEDKSALFRIPGGFRMSQDSTTNVNNVVTPNVVQGHLEGSNVSSLHEMVNLISISRAYELNNKVIQSLDDVQGKTIDVLGKT